MSARLKRRGSGRTSSIVTEASVRQSSVLTISVTSASGLLVALRRFLGGSEECASVLEDKGQLIKAASASGACPS